MKNFIGLLSMVLLFSCTSSSEKENAVQFSEGIHFTTSKDLQPHGIIKIENEYQLYYADPTQWNLVKSTNLIHWNTAKSIDIPGNAIGDVVVDIENTSGLGDELNSPILLIYNDDRVRMKYSLDRGMSWTSYDLQLPAGLSGNPKLTRSVGPNQWLMTLTEGTSVSILASTNLLEWSETAQVTLANEAPFADLAEHQGNYLLTTAGKSSSLYYLTNSFSVSNTASNWLKSTTAIQSSLTDVDGRQLLLSSLNQTALGLLMELSWDPTTTAITLHPVAEINDIALSKKRSTLKSLKGQGPSIFQFKLADFSSSIELKVFNEQGESVLLTFDVAKKSAVIDQTKASNAIGGAVSEFDWEPGQTFEANLIIDHKSLELILNEGAYLFSLPVDPVFIYDQLQLTVDGAEYNAGAIYYSLNTKAEAAPNS